MPCGNDAQNRYITSHYCSAGFGLSPRGNDEQNHHDMSFLYRWIWYEKCGNHVQTHTNLNFLPKDLGWKYAEMTCGSITTPLLNFGLQDLDSRHAEMMWRIITKLTFALQDLDSRHAEMMRRIELMKRDNAKKREELRAQFTNTQEQMKLIEQLRVEGAQTSQVGDSSVYHLPLSFSS